MSDPPSRPPRGERRKKIVTAARQLLLNVGPTGLNFDEIAREAGVSVAQLMRSFDTTAEVFQAILDDFYELLTADLPDFSDEDPITHFHAITQHLSQQTQQASDFRSILLRVLAEPREELTRVLVGFFNQLADLIEPTITAGQRAGVFRRTINPRMAAAEWLYSFLGVFLVVSVVRSPSPEAEAPTTAWTDCFLHGLLKTDI